MRRAAFALAALGSVAVAGEHPGRVVRVEQPIGREVFVPAGAFWMGVSDDDKEFLKAQCSALFEFPNNPLLQRQNVPCTDYSEELERMHQRPVFLSAFAIDRYEVTVAEYRACITAGMCNLD